MGFIEGFSLIFMSELGDKTFFIAALLAMKVGKAIAFFGSTTALTVMTGISVAIGVACAQVPAFVSSSIPVGEYLGAALLVFFGVKSIMAGLQGDPEGTGAELADAEESMDNAEKGGKQMSNFWGVASLIFVAEWGDRSMLATIALAIQNPPLGVAIGATFAHALATLIAVLGGSMASKYISERTVNLVGGALFLVFAVLTLLGYA